MKRLFDELAYDVSMTTTKKYSTSFSYGILALGPSVKKAIYAIYGYVRLADEIVDSFHNYNKVELMEEFKSQTIKALDEGISLNPILQSFQDTVTKYDIDRDLIFQFLKSMEMDLNPIVFDEEKYNEYILGSAEVVGLMCLQIFVDGNKDKYHALKPYAMKLGSAFQKVNFLRDMKDDYHVLGRTYFPGVDMKYFDNQVKAVIESDIEKEFTEALVGIKKLPPTSRFGVFLAYKYYFSLFKKIKKTSARDILQQRIRIPNTKKLSLMISCYVQYKFSVL
jgi:phytoene/squalene synthetase